MTSLKEYVLKPTKGQENMSQTIHMTWDCPACQRANLQLCRKPSLYQASLFTTSCLLCESQFLLKVYKRKGHAGSVGYVFLAGQSRKYTKAEIDKMVEKLLTSAKAEQTQGEIENGNTKL